MKKKIRQIALVGALAISNPATASPPKPIKFSEKDVDCLARNIYHEAYGESHQGKRAVAYVTINRMLDETYPDTICEVVKQPRQFEWVSRGKWKVKDQQAYKDSIMIAYSALINYSYKIDPTNGATMFHAKRIKPKWNWRLLVKTTSIGNHIFYKENS